MHTVLKESLQAVTIEWRRRGCHQECMMVAVRLSPCVQSIRVLRVLCREEFSIAAAKTFVEDVKRAMEWLTGHFLYTPEQVL